MTGTGKAPLRFTDERIETERLILRLPVFSDAPGLHAHMSHPDVCKFSPHRPFATVAEMHFVIVDWTEARERGVLTLIGALRSDPRTPIGFVQIGPDEELGGSLSPQMARNGLATEGLSAVFKAAKLQNAWTIIDAEHEMLIQTLAKVNMKQERLLPAHRIHPQISAQRRDCVLLRQQPS